MWISGRKLKMLEKRIADLESNVQSQQEVVNLLHCQKGRPLSTLDSVVQNVLKDSSDLTFRANLNGRKLFEVKAEQKQ